MVEKKKAAPKAVKVAPEPSEKLAKALKAKSVEQFAKLIAEVPHEDKAGFEHPLAMKLGELAGHK